MSARSPAGPGSSLSTCFPAANSDCKQHTVSQISPDTINTGCAGETPGIHPTISLLCSRASALQSLLLQLKSFTFAAIMFSNVLYLDSRHTHVWLPKAFARMDASPSVMSMARFDGVLSVLDFLSTVLSRHLSKEQNGLLILVNRRSLCNAILLKRCLLEGLELLLFPRSLSQPDSAAVARFLTQRQLHQFHPLIVFVVAPRKSIWR